jgi:hypothetical protein
VPPRHNYWTIIVGNQPTAFRSATREELLPTFRQLQAKHPDAVMMWFARGRLWKSEDEAQDALAQRRGPKPDWKSRDRGPRPEWKDRPPRDREDRPQWRDRPPGPREDRPQWRDRPPRPREDKPQWREQPARAHEDKPQWRDRPPRPREDKPQSRDRPRPPQGDRPFKPKDRWRDRPQGDRPQGDRPQGDRPPGNRPQGDRRGRDWRPGGDHKDPRDRFKVPRDVKRARFKDKLRRDRTNPKPPKKRDDEE